ncbi:hypothetical protein, partial [Trichormus sp. NMC-1]
ELDDDLKEEYDLSQLKNPIQGKYYQQYQEGYSVTIHNEDGTTTVKNFPSQNDIIVLDPDVKQYFPDSESVNSTLRSLIKLIPQK